MGDFLQRIFLANRFNVALLDFLGVVRFGFGLLGFALVAGGFSAPARSAFTAGTLLFLVVLCLRIRCL